MVSTIEALGPIVLRAVICNPEKELNDAVFALLHTPPRDNGFNRTTWRLADLHSTLRAKGVLTTMNNLSAEIKQTGYQWKKARVTLTSSDPHYSE